MQIVFKIRKDQYEDYLFNGRIQILMDQILSYFGQIYIRGAKVGITTDSSDEEQVGRIKLERDLQSGNTLKKLEGYYFNKILAELRTKYEDIDFVME